MKGERAELAEIIRRIGEGEIPASALTDERRSRGDLEREAVTPWGKVLFDEQQAIRMDWMNGAVSIARRPTQERRALWNSWKAKIDRMSRDPMGRYMTALPMITAPHVPTAADAFSRYQTELGAHAILLAAERHRLKTGKWPTSVEGIDRGILAHAPVDEFSGEPFCVEHEDNRVLIYSIGPNALDEHGAYNRRMWSYGGPDDGGASAWDVSLRRLSLAEEEGRAQ